jgi:hypothetical protein
MVGGTDPMGRMSRWMTIKYIENGIRAERNREARESAELKVVES